MDTPAPVLNPTPGAKPNQPFAGLEFRKDPSRPGGGVFVAKNVSRGASTPRTDGGADEPPAADEDEDERAFDADPSLLRDGVPTTRLLVLEENGHPRPLAQPSPASMSSPATVSTPGTAGSSAPAATPAPAPTPPVAAPAKESRRQPRGRRPSRQQTNGPPPTLAPPPPPPPPGLPALVGFNAGLGGPGLPNVNPAMDGLGADVRVMNALDMPSHPDGGGGTPSLDQLFPANMGFLESMPTTSMFDWGACHGRLRTARALTAPQASGTASSSRSRWAWTSSSSRRPARCMARRWACTTRRQLADGPSTCTCDI
jgi:hypothetical protein